MNDEVIWYWVCQCCGYCDTHCRCNEECGGLVEARGYMCGVCWLSPQLQQLCETFKHKEDEQ